MQPKQSFITINTDEEVIQRFLNEVVLQPRLNVLRWSAITKQSPGLRMGYPAQHLASLLTGVEGARTGARGDDLRDGTEVKSCNRIDQLDTCFDCGGKVLRLEDQCSSCGSHQIKRMNDSKWLLTVRSQDELELQTIQIDRFLFILLDYPFFNEGDFDEARIQAFEVWPSNSQNFTQLLDDYYNKIYLAHIDKNPSKTPAPKNFWPESFQFYMSTPIKTFECRIKDFNGTPRAEIKFFVRPERDRSLLDAERCPLSVLNSTELELLLAAYPDLSGLLDQNLAHSWAKAGNLSKAKKAKLLKEIAASVGSIPSEMLGNMALRDTSRAVAHATAYRRR